jgi:dipeptidyl aminopeptidase/acylaminoacyl peptidase
MKTPLDSDNAALRDAHFGLRARHRPDVRRPDGLWPELVVGGWDRVHNHAVSPDGKRVAFLWDRDGHSDLWVLPLDRDGFPKRLTLNRPHVNWWEDEPPAWSPDSQWVVYGSYNEDGVSNLHIVSGNGGPARQLTDLNADAAEPCFSPDGQFIVFSTHQGDSSQIAMVPFDGGWVIGLTFSDDECTSPVWSPDGTRVVYSASPQHGRRQNDLYVIAIESGSAHGASRRLTPDDNVECWSPAFSADGARVALLSNRSGFDELWMMASDGTRLTQLTQLGRDIEEFIWLADGGRLAAIVNHDACDTLYVVDAATGATRQVNCPPGNYSVLQRCAHPDALIVNYDAPASAPAMYRIDLRSGAMTALTNACAAALDHAPFVSPQHVHYESGDGWDIPALLYTPPGGVDDPRGWPAIVYPHGGPNVHYDLSWDPVRQFFVAKGYVVICPNFRGSTGYGRHFKEGNLNAWGVGDLADCLAAADFLGGDSRIDRARMAIWGQSYGGYLTQLALMKDQRYRFKCGVCLFGDSHLKTSWASGDHSGRQDLEWQMGAPGENSARYEASSPLNFVRDLRAPLLILHGELDQRVAVSESHQLVEALMREHKTFEFHAYPEEGHGFARVANALDAVLRIERFLDWWLM